MIFVRAIRLRSITASNVFGTDIFLDKFLNVIQADNTSGKSTCLQTIIYCLGMERSLSSRLDVPLPLAMRERIENRKNGPLENVIQSYAVLELENSSGEVISVRRDITGGNDQKLVQVWFGGLLTEKNENFEREDYFLFDGGAAVRENGFHAFLAKFIGWKLPNVPKYDGEECLLYMETLFPMFFVEQKRGWATIQGPFPTFLGIQDMSRRALEFILDLDAGKVRRQRTDVLKSIKKIEQEWTAERKATVAEVGSLIRLTGLPYSPNAEFSKDPVLDMSIYHDDSWQSFTAVIKNTNNRISELDKVEFADVSAATDQLNQKLESLQNKYEAMNATIAVVRREFQLNNTEHNSVEKRLALLKIDLARNLDAKKLQSLGSVLGTAVSDHSCPTCHQGVSRELLPETTEQGMAIDENIAFIRSQIDLYKSVSEATESKLNSARIRHRSLNDEIKSLRASIRGVKRDLVRPESSKLRSTLEELIRTQGKLERWNSLQEKLDGKADGLKSIASQWVAQKDLLKKLGGGQLSASDKSKLSEFQTTIQSLLKLFGFTSFKPEEIVLSSDNFRPQVFTINEEGEAIEKDIGFEASASDGIRLKWAYYLSLISLSQQHSINHLGFVAFDEPGQQEMKDVDLSSFLNWSAQNLRADRQVIVTTSEDLGRVQNSVANGQANVISYDDYILKVIQ